MQRIAKTGAVTLFAFLLSATCYADPKRINIKNPAGYLAIEFLSDRLVHFELSAKGLPPATSDTLFTTPMVDRKSYDGPSAFIAEANSFKTKDLRINIDQGTLCVRMTYLKRQYDLAEICPHNLAAAWKGVTINAPGYKDLLGLGQNFPQATEHDPSWRGRVNIPGRYGNELRGYAGGAVGHTQIPMLYALGEEKKNFALFFDNPYKQGWNFQKDPWLMETWGDQIRWYAFAGDGIQEIRQNFMDLTGKPPLPAKKMLGFWLSEFGFDSWSEVFKHKEALQAKQFPLDGFGMDLQWYGGSFGDPDHSRMGTLSWDAQNFPDAPTQIKNLAAEGLGLMLIEQPYVGKNLSEHQALADAGFFARDCETCGASYIDHNPWWGRGGLIDFTNPVAGKFWHQSKRRPLIRQGIYAHWCDLGEPEMYNDWSWYSGIPGASLHQHGDVHNLYNLMWAKSIADGYAGSDETQRPFILSRSGAAGIQRYRVALWSGDIGANITSMLAHQRAQHHLGLVGIDYYGSDIGGFYRPAGDGQEALLYSIWLANSLITDVPARTHIWNLKQNYINNPALIGDVESNLSNLRLRYQLLPYYYSLAQHATASGAPIVAPLLYFWQEDVSLRKIDLQKMLGPSLMASLLTSYEGKVSMTFPKGRWFDFRTLEPVNTTTRTQTIGGGIAKIEVPLFITEGGIIPMYGEPERIKHTGDIQDQPLVFLLAPSTKASSFYYYDDDGKTMNGGAKTGLTLTQKSEENGDTTLTVKADSQTTPTHLRHVTVKVLSSKGAFARLRWNGLDVPPCRGNTLPCSEITTRSSNIRFSKDAFFAGGELILRGQLR